MTEELKQTIKEELEKIPRENREAINAFGWADLVEKIGEKYLFDENMINDLQVETFLVLIGLEDIRQFPTNVENKVNTTTEEAQGISNEIEKAIFVPINNILVENIKKNVTDKDVNHEQNLNFILSGGDYSTLANGNSNNEEYAKEEETKIPIKPK